MTDRPPDRGTIRGFRGRPTEPTPLPDEVPWSVPVPDRQPKPTTEPTFTAAGWRQALLSRWEVPRKALDIIEAEARADERERLAEAVRELPTMPVVIGPWDGAGTADAVLMPAVLAILDPEADPPGAYGEPMQGDGRAT